VIERLRVGKSYKTISYELRITASTARVIGARALRKLGTNVQFLRYQGLVEQ
jgi:DNA-binding NarL/FixJ family response regulator